MLFISVLAFVDMMKFLFTIPGLDAFLSQKICQDPLEKFFGCQRQRGRVHENPNVQDFIKNTQALRVVGNCTDTVKGNCRGNKSREPLDLSKENQAFPKRKKKK